MVGEMIASESETGGSGRGKALAWRSRSCKDTAPGVGRDAGSESGRDIGRNIASWWTSAVEQTSTFLMDEVPATFAGLSVGAKELKPALQRGASFSSFSLGWKLNGEGSKGAVEVPKCPEDVPPEGSKLELPKVSPRLRLERSLERSHSRKQVEKAQSPSLSSAKLLDRSPHSSKNLLEKVQEPSVSSPKQLERSSHTTKNVENMQQPSLSLPKQLERSPHRTKKHVEETQEPSASLPKQLERSPQRTLEHVEKIHEPSSKPFKWIPLTATKHEAKLSAMETPSEVSPGKASMYSGKSPLRSGESPLSALEIPTYTDSSPRKGTKSLPRKASKHVENSSLETPKPSPSKSTKHMEKSPHSTPKTPVIPSESSPIITTDPRSSSRLRESRRRTKRMPVDIATTELEASPAKVVRLSTVNQEFLLGEGITPGSAGVRSLEVLQRQRIWTPQKTRTDSPEKSNPGSSIKRVDGSGLGSSNRSYSSRSLARSLHFDETMKYLSPQLTAVGTPDSCGRVHVHTHKHGVVLPREEIFPGKTNRLPQIRVRTPTVVETSGDLSKNPLFGGSTRMTQRDEQPQSRLSGSLPTSPRYAPGESRTSRLLRKLKFTGRGSGAGLDDSKLGKRRGSTKAGKAMTDCGPKESSNLHREFSENVEPSKLDFSYRNWTDPNLGETMLRELEMAMNNGAHHDPAFSAEAESSEVHGGIEASQNSVRKQQGILSSETSEKQSVAWPWSFKWKWRSKSRSKAAKGAVKASSIPQQRPSTSDQRPDEFASPTADIMNDARDTFLSQSDRFSTRGSADKLVCDRAPKHRRVLSWGAGTTSSLCSGSDPAMTAFTPSQPRLPTRDAQELLLPPRKLLVPPSVNVLRRSQEQVALPEGKRSHPTNFLRGSSDSDMFEDCFGSFRSTDSPTKSYGSFKSIESPTVSGTSVRKTTGLSIDADEWDAQVSSSFRQEIHGSAECNEDPCTSTTQFVFKCPKVQQFNNFLRAQKERLRNGLVAGNTDRFCIVLTGRDLELSSIVSAMSYAWLQENSFPSVSGDKWHPVPMIDVPRQKMDKHKDAAWLLDACGIDAGSLLFADEVELSALMGAGRIKMSIIGQDVLVTRNEVGSVCTLLTEMLLGGHRGLLQPRFMKAFMLAGILLDTENLDFASMRDTAMSNILVEGMGYFGRTSYYSRLREADDDARVSKLITQNYIDNQPSARLKRAEAEHEHSDRDSIFTQSQDHTSTSEAGTNSSLDEDSPRPKLRQRSSFKYSRLPPHSAPAKFHRLSLPGGCMDQDAQAVAHIRKAATQSGHPSSALPSYKPSLRREKSSAFTRIRKNLFFAG